MSNPEANWTLLNDFLFDQRQTDVFTRRVGDRTIAHCTWFMNGQLGEREAGEKRLGDHHAPEMIQATDKYHKAIEASEEAFWTAFRCVV